MHRVQIPVRWLGFRTLFPEVTKLSPLYFQYPQNTSLQLNKLKNKDENPKQATSRLLIRCCLPCACHQLHHFVVAIVSLMLIVSCLVLVVAIVSLRHVALPTLQQLITSLIRASWVVSWFYHVDSDLYHNSSPVDQHLHHILILLFIYLFIYI